MSVSSLIPHPSSLRLQHAIVAYACVTAAVTASPNLFLDNAGRVIPISWLGLALAGAGLVFAVVAASHRQPAAGVSSAFLVSRLGLLLGLELLFMFRERPNFYGNGLADGDARLIFRGGVVLLAAAAATYCWSRWPWPRLRCTVMLGLYTLLASGLLVQAKEAPVIDVWHLQQQACARLLHGENPYTGLYTHPFTAEDERAYLAPETVQDGKIRSFPYPPLCILLALPGYLAGDVRWSYLAALIGTAVLLLATIRRLGLKPGHPAELAVWLFLCHPRGLLVLESGQTEPFLALSLTGAVWAAAAKREKATGALVGTVLSAKQYALLALPAMWASAQFSLRSLITGAVLALALVLPFWLWDPSAFWFGIVEFHVYSPFRPNSLSVLAAVVATTGYHLPPLVGFLGAGGVACLLVWRQVRGLAGVGLGTAAVLLVFILFNKAAHINYYWLASFALALGIVVLAAEESQPSGAA